MYEEFQLNVNPYWKMKKDGILEALDQMVDVQKLKTSEELGTSMEEEAKRQQLDTAKKRAAAQNVDYPCFAALISCAHLKPMTHKELNTSIVEKNQRHSSSIPAWSFDLSGHLQLSNIQSSCRQIQNTVTECKVTKAGHTMTQYIKSSYGFNLPDLKSSPKPSPEVATSHLAADLRNGPRRCDNITTNSVSRSGVKSSQPSSKGLHYSSDFFTKEWKKLDSLDHLARLRFLRKIPPSSWPFIFSVGIPSFLLGEILQTLHASIENINKMDHAEVEKENDSSKGCISSNLKNVSDYDGASDFDIEKFTSVTNHSGSDMMDQTEECQFKQMDEVKVIPIGDVGATEKMVHWVLSILDAVRSCGRFRLAIKFMGQKYREIAREIINWAFGATASKLLTGEVQALDLLSSYNCT